MLQSVRQVRQVDTNEVGRHFFQTKTMVKKNLTLKRYLPHCTIKNLQKVVLLKVNQKMEYLWKT